MATPPAKKSGSPKFNLTTKYGPLPAWGWIAVLVVGVVIYKKLKSNSSGTASTAGTTSSTTTPTETLTTSGGTYTGPAGDAPGSVTNPTTDPTTGTTVPPSAPASLTPTPGGGSGTASQFGVSNPGQPGQGEGIGSFVDFGSSEYEVVGSTDSSGLFSGYNVGGGAPVYATQPGQGTPMTGFNPSGAGQVLYVAAANSSAVNTAAPVSGEKL